MGLAKIGTHQHSELTWGIISGDKEKILVFVFLFV
jgi:hypothetical protein